jgi:hypothetical protein
MDGRFSSVSGFGFRSLGLAAANNRASGFETLSLRLAGGLLKPLRAGSALYLDHYRAALHLLEVLGPLSAVAPFMWHSEVCSL